MTQARRTATLTADPPPRRSYSSLARDQQKRETRGRILDSALRHFSEHGVEAGSLREIAAQAGVTHAVIRLHFGSKEDLWRAAIAEMFQRQEKELGHSSLSDGAPLTAESLSDFVHRYVRYCARHPEHVRIMIHETLRDRDRVQWVVENHIRPAQASLVRLFSRAIADGVLPDVPIPSLIYILTSASQMIFALGAEAKHLHGLDVDDPSVIEAHAEAICTLLFATPRR